MDLDQQVNNMKKRQFIKFMSLAEKQDKRIDELSDFISYDSPLLEFGWIMFDAWVESNFVPDGQDWISWWLWERISINGETNKAYDSEDNEIPTETLDDLWEIVKKYTFDSDEESCDTKSDIS